MPNPDEDPLWYDRAEPDAASGPLLRLTALAFVGSRACLARAQALGAAILEGFRYAVERIAAIRFGCRNLLRLFD